MSNKIFLDIILAKTPEEREEAKRKHREAVAIEPTDSGKPALKDIK